MAKMLLTIPRVPYLARLQFSIQGRRFFAACSFLQNLVSSVKTQSQMVPRYAASARAVAVSQTRLSLGHIDTGSRGRRGISTGATNVSDAGSIDSSMMKSMQQKIKDALNAETVIVKDAYGDGRHVSIYVVSSIFEGESAVSRQRMVYKAIWEELQTTVHAVDQMVTKTPAEADS